MATVAWIGLALLAAAIVFGSTVITVKTFRLWRSFRSLQRAVADALGDIVRKATDVEDRLAGAGDSAARLDAAVARLRDSTSRAEVLATAFGELRASTRRARGVVPRK
jgi:hypothetical protein